MVHEEENDIAVEQESFALAGVRHIGQLMRGDVQLLRQLRKRFQISTE